jgi:hypothetical protein
VHELEGHVQQDIITISGVSHVLAEGQDVQALKDAVVDAVRSGADFVTFTTAGNDAVSTLLSAGVSVTFTSQDLAAHEIKPDGMSDADLFYNTDYALAEPYSDARARSRR